MMAWRRKKPQLFVLAVVLTNIGYLWQIRCLDSSVSMVTAVPRATQSNLSIPAAQRQTFSGNNTGVRLDRTRNADQVCASKCISKDCTIHFQSTHNESSCYIAVDDTNIPCRNGTSTSSGDILAVHMGYQCQILDSRTFTGPSAVALDGRRNTSFHDYAKGIPRGEALAVLVTSKWLSHNRLNFHKVFRFLDSNQKQSKNPRTKTNVAFIWKSGFNVTDNLYENNLNISWERAYMVGLEYEISRENISWHNLSMKFPGSENGHHSPEACKPREKVAVIVPYRLREHNLRIFLNNIIPFLKMQGVTFAVYIVEQEGPVIFNRAILLNIGFMEAQKVDTYDAYVFHDVDKLPEDLCNIYTCSTQPRHLAVALDKYTYRPIHEYFVGGAACLNHEHMLSINGFSNMFFGWGGEDDEMYKRLHLKNLQMSRYPLEIARYSSLDHHSDAGNPRSGKRKEQAWNNAKFMLTDGLSSLEYNLTRHVTTQLYHHLYVYVDGPHAKKNIKEHYQAEVDIAKAIERKKQLEH